MLDARAWLAWALAVLLTAASTRNPLYLALVLLIVLFVGASSAALTGRRPSLAPLRFAALAIPFATLFNGLTAHLGDTVLFRLPAWLPLLGGAVTLESLAYGAINGLALTIILAAFTTLNQVIPVRELVRLTPRAFHESGMVLAIALTLIPQTVRALARIREAQAVRGHRLRGLRDALPVYVPLLVDGLERSLSLAEAMVARGYGSLATTAQPLPLRGLLALGLLALLGSWLAWLFVPAQSLFAAGGMVAGGALIVSALALAGRSSRSTRYRPRRWRAAETLVVLGCGAALAAALAGHLSLAYTPYPQLAAPLFEPSVGVGLLALLAPLAAAAKGAKAE